MNSRDLICAFSTLFPTLSLRAEAAGQRFRLRGASAPGPALLHGPCGSGLRRPWRGWENSPHRPTPTTSTCRMRCARPAGRALRRARATWHRNLRAPGDGAPPCHARALNDAGSAPWRAPWRHRASISCADRCDMATVAPRTRSARSSSIVPNATRYIMQHVQRTRTGGIASSAGRAERRSR